MTRELFQMALNITEPWYVADLKFDVESKRLDIYIDFQKGSTIATTMPSNAHKSSSEYYKSE